jgi:hypothetical protein
MALRLDVARGVDLAAEWAREPGSRSEPAWAAPYPESPEPPRRDDDAQGVERGPESDVPGHQVSNECRGPTGGEDAHDGAVDDKAALHGPIVGPSGGASRWLTCAAPNDLDAFAAGHMCEKSRLGITAGAGSKTEGLACMGSRLD